MDKSRNQVFAAAEAVKTTKYQTKCNDVGVQFVPAVLGSVGGFGKPALDLIDILATLKEAHGKIPKSVSVHRFRAAISMAVVRTQANAWIQAGRGLEAIDTTNGLQHI